MISRHPSLARARFGVATAAAALLVTGCSAGEPAEHPVFSAPRDQQPAKALEATLATDGFVFRQTTTFELGAGEAELTSEGRMAPKAGHAVGTRSWIFTKRVTTAEREALLGRSPAPSPQPSQLGVAVDGTDVLVRPGAAPYWIRHAPIDFTLDGNRNVESLAGTQVPFGGTLLELLASGGRVTKSAAARTGRTYTVRTPAPAALALFPKDLRDLLHRGTDEAAAPLPVDLELHADGEGRLTRASADLGALKARKWGSLRSLKTIRAELTISRHGAPAPKLPSAARQLPAQDTVREIDELEPGACFDPHTGTSSDRMVVGRPCETKHGARVLAQPELNLTYPGADEARRRADAACDRAVPASPAAWRAESAERDTHWFTWPTDKWDWNEHGAAHATCYVLTD
ncbi:hypothetical protein ACFY9S_31055 [Streptomyces sp. NPDC012474]|uniref:hypothetical protein n=1 Tax=Streptomyces sp. NPDC012474 TaxID=3364836 RepID=UPI0036EEE347